MADNDEYLVLHYTLWIFHSFNPMFNLFISPKFCQSQVDRAPFCAPFYSDEPSKHVLFLLLGGCKNQGSLLKQDISEESDRPCLWNCEEFWSIDIAVAHQINVFQFWNFASRCVARREKMLWASRDSSLQSQGAQNSDLWVQEDKQR